MNIIRLFSSATRSVSSSELAQLRKRTGFSLINCRKALQENQNDVLKAEEWLKNEAKRLGWEKAMKLENRAASEGLVAVAQAKNKVVMAEINCETDFVARTEKFVSLAQTVARACLSHPVPNLNKNVKKTLLAEELADVETPQKEKLSDYIIKHIGEFGEKIVLRRVLYYEADNDVHIGIATHPSASGVTEIHTGKFGAFVAYQKLPESKTDISDSSQKLGQNLCKHIIGFNPSKIGSSEDLPVEQERNEECEKDTNSSEDFASEEINNEALIHQKFLLDHEKTVGEVLSEHGTTVIDFHRFQCGEDDIEPKSDKKELDIEGNVKMRCADGN